jgi:hypothetical protein
MESDIEPSKSVRPSLKLLGQEVFQSSTDEQLDIIDNLCDASKSDYSAMANSLLSVYVTDLMFEGEVSKKIEDKCKEFVERWQKRIV